MAGNAQTPVVDWVYDFQSSIEELDWWLSPFLYAVEVKIEVLTNGRYAKYSSLNFEGDEGSVRSFRLKFAAADGVVRKLLREMAYAANRDRNYQFARVHTMFETFAEQMKNQGFGRSPV